jgi:NADH-quinone oxidoreductase subunit N
MAAVDGMGNYMKLVLLAGVLMVLWMSADYAGFQAIRGEEMAWGTYASLLLMSTVGLLLLVSSTDLLMVVISLELISITSFILTGYLKGDRRSSEAAIKFFLVGAFASGLMLYGISLLYGVLGSTGLQDLVTANLAAVPRLPLVGGVLFLLAGLGFKMAMVPFHMWVPDAYEGAPTPITAYLSVAPKAAAFGALARILPHHASLEISSLLAVLAAATMTVGNFSALRQTNVKRMLGYSSIAQMGYVLVGFVAAGPLGIGSVLVYTAAYLFMNLGAFACVIAVANEAKTDHIDGFAGLASRSFGLALITTVFMLSLTGIPPLVGFVGKFSVFAAAVQEGWIWSAVAGVLNSVVSVYYYFSIVHRMFFQAPARTGKFVLTPSLAGCVIVTLFVTLAVGIFPNTWLAWVGGVVP